MKERFRGAKFPSFYQKTNIYNMKNLIIPEELSKSFAKTTDDRTATEYGFKKWFAEIVFNYHPINNFIF